MTIVPLFLLVTLVGALSPRPVAAVELELERLNRTYTDVMPGKLVPFASELLTVELQSPRQAIEVREHRLRLAPTGGGHLEGVVEIELAGSGDLVADIALGAGAPQRLTGELLLPEQRIVLAGAVRIERAAGGYRAVVERLPPSVEIEIRSRLVDELLDACAGFSLLTLGALDCAPIGALLEHPRVPLPAAGSELFVADADLSDADRAELDRLLGAF